jgi:hypothetical protein
MTTGEDAIETVIAAIILVVGLGILANLSAPGSITPEQIATVVEFLVYVFVVIVAFSVIKSAVE